MIQRYHDFLQFDSFLQMRWEEQYRAKRADCNEAPIILAPIGNEAPICQAPISNEAPITVSPSGTKNHKTRGKKL